VNLFREDVVGIKSRVFIGYHAENRNSVMEQKEQNSSQFSKQEFRSRTGTRGCSDLQFLLRVFPGLFLHSFFTFFTSGAKSDATLHFYWFVHSRNSYVCQADQTRRSAYVCYVKFQVAEIEY